MPVNGFDNAKNKTPVYSKDELDPNLESLNSHIENTDIHTSATERATTGAHIADTDIHTSAAERESTGTHIADTDIHITSAERSTWNAKVGLDGGGKIDVGVMPDEVVLDSEKAASGGIATLDSSSRIPVSQMPIGVWEESTIPASSISTSWYNFSVPYYRAKVIINVGLELKFYGDYTRSRAEYIGICTESKIMNNTRMGNLLGEHYLSSNSEHLDFEIGATASGQIRFRLLSGGTAKDISIMVRQDA